MLYFSEIQRKSLSKREREVLAAIAQGKQYKEIAQKLFISIHTVNFHKKNLYKKLNVHSQSEAAILALRSRLV